MSTPVLIQELALCRDLLRKAERIWVTPKVCIKRSGEDFLLLFYPGSVAIFLAQTGVNKFTWSNGGEHPVKRFNTAEEAFHCWNTHQQRLLGEPWEVCRG